jgi:hypothetical protein
MDENASAVDAIGTPIHLGDIVVVAAQAQGKRPHIRIARVVALEDGFVIVAGIMQRRMGRASWRKAGHQVAVIGEAASGRLIAHRLGE